MSSLALSLFAATLIAAAPRAPEPDPECQGGTTVKVTADINGNTKHCVRPNGQKEGPFLRFYASGAMHTRGSFHNNKLHGDWSRWDDKGTLREQGAYKEGAPTGYWTSFHANGKKQTTKEYDATGLRRGLWQTWDQNGKVLEEGEYRENEKHGFWVTYDPKTGKPLKSIEYSNGKPRPQR